MYTICQFLQDLLILQSCIVQELMINGESALLADQQPIIS